MQLGMRQQVALLEGAVQVYAVPTWGLWCEHNLVGCRHGVCLERQSSLLLT